VPVVIYIHSLTYLWCKSCNIQSKFRIAVFLVVQYKSGEPFKDIALKMYEILPNIVDTEPHLQSE